MVEYRIHIRTHRVNILLIIEHICTSTSNKYSVELEDIYILFHQQKYVRVSLVDVLLSAHALWILN